MTEEIKNCAHCESDAISAGIYEISEDSPEYCGDDARMAKVRCEYCGIGVKYITDLDYSEKLFGQLIKRWNRRASPWVSIEDKLPDIGVKVWVRDKDDFTIEARRIRRKNNDATNVWESFFMGTTEYTFHVNEITHWMPIPPLPEIER